MVPEQWHYDSSYAHVVALVDGSLRALGTTNPQRLTDATAGSSIPLTRGEWYRLVQAAGHRVP